MPIAAVTTARAGTSVMLSTEARAALVLLWIDARHTQRTSGPRASSCAVSTVTSVTPAPTAMKPNMVRLLSMSVDRP